MSRRGRKNWSNFEINKRICKQLILHRVWNDLSQTDLSKDIGTTFQQYQKNEKCANRIFAEQLISICNNRKWDLAIFQNANPEDTLDEWMKKDYRGIAILDTSSLKSYYGENKYNKIKNAWKLLDTNGSKSYYGNVKDPDPDHISNMKPIIPKGD
tara:strand:- start:476 stop:940 length:465 start_codon:yes stop_codon:yes gene_type:complete